MKLHIEHVTHYDYSAPLQYALQSYCLTPQSSAHQTVHDWAVTAPGTLFAARDAYGNLAHTCSMTGRPSGGEVRASGTVETHAHPLLEDAVTPVAVYLRHTPLTAPDERLHRLGEAFFRAGGAGLEANGALGLARAIVECIPYQPRTTGVHTTAEEALAQGAGVCQDHAHVFISVCRSHGVAARYVSGYFHAPGAQHLASHAWVDVCVDPARHRWLSVDVTHACLMDERHVRLAVGPDYAACAPIRGVREGGGAESMHVHIDIRQAADPVAVSTVT
jgi:transglutaminase-like putative cysteine protease